MKYGNIKNSSEKNVPTMSWQEVRKAKNGWMRGGKKVDKKTGTDDH